jgi:hypothetical protein
VSGSSCSAELALADTGEGQREEHQQHVFGAAELTPGDRLSVLVAQREVVCGSTHRQHQRRPARDFGCTNWLAFQSPRLTDDVSISSAVGADSAISAGCRRCRAPSRPRICGDDAQPLCAGLFPTDLDDIASRLNAVAQLTVASQHVPFGAKQPPTKHRP